MPVRRSSNHIPSSPVEAPMKQGIVTILGADCHKNTKAGSIRRTLSADMSSKKWLAQNGFSSPIKNIADEEEFGNNPNQDQVWKSIQAQKEKNELLQKPAQTQSGVWGQILTQKSENSLLQTLYVHPTVKRSSSLTDKSLEICTESLGSETGSDCFSASSDGDHEERDREEMQREEHQVKVEDPFADLHVVKYKNSPPMPFPPPMPSIAAADGPSLHMQSRRENGRLVLEAVSVAPRNYFHAQRQNGRLLLTLNHAPANLEFEEEEEKLQFDEMEVAGENVEEMVDRCGGARKSGGGIKEESLDEQNLSLPTGMISVHKSVLMKKLMVVGNINPKWSDDDDVATRDGEDQLLPIPQSLPPRRPPVAPRMTPPAAAAAASFNAYEYFWRTKPGLMTATNKDEMNQDLVKYMRGCKEARRSLLWAPYCIATS